MVPSSKRKQRDQNNEQNGPTPNAVAIKPSRNFHSKTLFLVLILLSTLQSFASSHNWPLPGPVDEHQLQQIATLMDDIYTSLANSTFIPHSAIKRGPHEIDTTSITCQRSPAALRLLEILPYVDVEGVIDSSWRIDDEFLDYRRPDHIEFSCKSLHSVNGRNEHYIHDPHTVPLTTWTMGGDRFDQTWALVYDTKKHAMRVFNGGRWDIHATPGMMDDRDRVMMSEWYQRVEGKNREPPLDSENEWAKWVDAPTRLRGLKEAIELGVWSPWHTTDSLRRFGLSRMHHISLLRSNGWPDAFDPDDFAVDLVRAQYPPSGLGFAEDATNLIKDYVVKTMYPNGYLDPGNLAYAKSRVTGFQESILVDDTDRRWLYTLWLEQAKWNLEFAEDDLKVATETRLQLCPNNTCVKPEDHILWEFRAIETLQARLQDTANATVRCQHRMDNLPYFIPPDADRLSHCVAQLNAKQRWLDLAYSETKSEALIRCANTGQDLLPPDSLESRAQKEIASLKKSIARDLKRLVRLDGLKVMFPKGFAETNMGFNMEKDQLNLGTFGMRYRIKEIEGSLAKREDREVLWRTWDEEGPYEDEWPPPRSPARSPNKEHPVSPKFIDREFVIERDE